MKKNIFNLSLKNLWFNKNKIIFICAGIISVTIIIYILSALSLGIKNNIINKYLETVPVNEITVSQKSFVMNLPFLKNLSLDSKKNINDTALQKIKSYDNVKQVIPVQNVDFPVSIMINMFGYTYQSDLTVAGIPEKLIKNDNIKLSKPFTFDFKNDKMIPVIVNYKLIDLYNSNFAKSNNLPKLSYDSIIGRNFTLIFGKSSLSDSGKTEKFRCEIIGLSERADLLGLTIPIDTVKKLNHNFIKNYSNNYSAVYVKTFKVSQINSVIDKIKKLGFNCYSLSEIVNKINTVSISILSLISLTVILIGITVIFNIFNYFMTLIKSQSNDIKILRYIGFSIKQIKKIYSYQAIIIAFFSAFISVILSRLIIYFSNSFLIQKIHKITNIQINIFITPYYFDLIIIFTTVFVTLITVRLATSKK